MGLIDTNLYKKLKPSGKFGYSLETFRLSALASMEAQSAEIITDENIGRTNERIFGDFNNFANANFKAVISKIAVDYCYEQSPNCECCPVRLICGASQYALTAQISSKQKTSSLSFADMFCGAGGLSSGLVDVGMRPVFAIDSDPAAVLTYSLNHSCHAGLHVETNDADEMEKQRFSAITRQRPDVIVGGPPCQGFSNANRQRLSEDPRNHLYKTFLSALKASEAKYAILENVPGMLKAAPSIAGEFEEIGYTVEFFLLDAKDFNVPQSRKRLFVIAKRSTDFFNDKKFFDAFKYSLADLKSETRKGIFEVISDLPPVKAKTIANATEVESIEFGFSCWIANMNASNDMSIVFNHRSKYLNDRDTQLYTLLKPGEDTSAQSIEDLNPYRDRDHIFKDKFFRLHPDKPSKTITAHMYYDTHMYIHPYQARGLTPREAARIQGFRDTFVFLGYPNEWYRQIGNAVSPTVASAVGKSLQFAESKIHE